MLSGHESYIFFILLQLAKAKLFQVDIFSMDMKKRWQIFAVPML